MTLKKEEIAHLKSDLARYNELESNMADASIASDPEQMKVIGKEFAGLVPQCRLYVKYVELNEELEKCRAEADSESDAEMAALYEEEIKTIVQEIDAIDKELDKHVNPDEPDENRPVIIEIRSGTGGDEAALFVGDLFRMYSKYSEIKGWKLDPISSSPTQLGGFKEVIFSIAGKNVFNHLRHESGVHRVQRVPATEASGRIHTSASTVAVMIEPDEVDVEINPVDLKIDTFRAQGSGGQHVNKTDSAIRVTHLPSKIVVECQDERSQHQNRAKAMRLLRARLLDQLEIERQKKISAERKTQVGSGDRSERIRTYNFPQNRVTDHRAEITLYKLEFIIEGEMDLLIDPLLQYMKEKRLADKG